MDNLDKIKFKYSIPGYLFKIDNSGKTEFKTGTRYIEELKAWEALGNKIEPRYTVNEQAKKDEKETEQEAIAWIGKRKSKYPITDELIVALWEKEVEGRPESADALEIIRQAVKEEIPKPS